MLVSLVALGASLASYPFPFGNHHFNLPNGKFQFGLMISGTGCVFNNPGVMTWALTSFDTSSLVPSKMGVVIFFHPKQKCFRVMVVIPNKKNVYLFFPLPFVRLEELCLVNCWNDVFQWKELDLDVYSFFHIFQSLGDRSYHPTNQSIEKYRKQYLQIPLELYLSCTLDRALGLLNHLTYEGLYPYNPVDMCS